MSGMEAARISFVAGYCLGMAIDAGCCRCLLDNDHELSSLPLKARGAHASQ
jgi:hypothetical protein